ncbi:putative sensory transduction regulator [Micromonospora kangleipakensis]|uniref:Putative sensory transduction regulator n=1 Tax=Micromonospora kangleipakensis TaxID=1077942 RepID=A0A4Q8B9A0_9ACTN|nr:YbjN domain-containing protein [Micromonospora kangleipakensis]RZU74068.1 putative sensory transduction regulator [Micromonospora kangleipakensis]
MTISRGRGLAEALADARDLPDGEARFAELERIAGQADATGDPGTALAARLALIEGYLHHGERWRLLEPVRRCLAAVDRAPGLLAGRPDDAETLRRHQRQAVEAFLGTPRVGLDQARSLLDDLADRLGPDAEPVAELRCRLADHLGDEPTARRECDRWRHGSARPTPGRDPEQSAAAPDPAGGCPGCAPARRAELLAGWGEHAAALDALRPVLDGEVRCTDQPERALAVALLPWLRTGAADRAGRAHLRAYRRHRRERTAFPQLAAHLRFCALGGHLDRGLDILAEQLPRLDHPYDDLSAMEFAAAGALLCALAAEAGRGGRRLHRPGHGPRPAAEVDVATLGADLLAVATELAGSFDARNGTGHQAGRIASWLAERPLADPVPLAAEDDPDEWPADPATERAEPPAEEPAPLSLALVTAALDRRGDGYGVEPDGAVVGRWGEAVIRYRRLGQRGEILHARVVATRRLPAARRAEAYAFCNAWNHDRLLPKAYVHELDEGELLLAGDVSTDLEHGVAPVQLDVLIDATVATGVGYAAAVAALP